MSRAWQTQSSLHPPESWQNLHPTSPRRNSRRDSYDSDATEYEDLYSPAATERKKSQAQLPRDAWYNLQTFNAQDSNDGVRYGTRLEPDRKVLLTPKALYDPNAPKRFSYTPFTAHEDPPIEIKTRIDLNRLKPKKAPRPFGLKLYALCAVLCLVAFLVMLNGGIVATAIPAITADFNSIPDIGWYGSAFMLANCAVQPLSGKIYHCFVTKWTFLTFLAIFEVGSTICGAAQSSNMLIIGRAVAGLGAAGLGNGGIIIITAAVPLAKRPVYISIIMSMASIGQVVGPLIGGALTQAASWRWCFFLNLPLGGIAAAVIFFVDVPNSQVVKAQDSVFKTVTQKLDLIGFVLFAPSIIMLLLALQWGGAAYTWGSPTIIGLFCGAGGLFIIFCGWEWHEKDKAMIPPSLLMVREVALACVSTFFSRGGVFLQGYYLPIWFQIVQQASPILSGVYTLPSIMSQVAMALVAGTLVSKLGYYTPWAIAGNAIIAVGSGLMSTFTPDTYPGNWVGYQLIVGCGRGMIMQMPILAIQAVLPPQKIPLGISLQTFSQTFGGALFIACGQTLFINRLPTEKQEFAKDGPMRGMLEAYNAAVTETFYIVVGASVVAFFASFGMGWSNIKDKKKQLAKLQQMQEQKKLQAEGLGK